MEWCVHRDLCVPTFNSGTFSEKIVAQITPRENKLGELHVEIRVELVSQDSTMFAQLDTDRNGYLNLAELRGAVALLYPAAAWDDSVWRPFCEQYGESNPQSTTRYL